MTREEFVNREIATWGDDYIIDLFERGYVAIELQNGTHSKWTWLLTNTPKSATVVPGSGAGFTPVFPTSRAFRT